MKPLLPLISCIPLMCASSFRAVSLPGDSLHIPAQTCADAIEHGLSHLLILLVVGHGTRTTIIAFDSETSNSGLIEHVLVVLAEVSVMTLIIYIG